MKRKNEDPLPAPGEAKRRAIGDEEAKSCFRKDLFAPEVATAHAEEYLTSQPYKHGVIQNLIDDSLLRSVRHEILEHLHFTPKETDIYKIHQSGDLANLDGLDNDSLGKLPSLLRLRDAMYSPAFRALISKVANSGPLSGRKTDMAINVYTPGCHLLCHDDVIGSRRLSYILYLNDPDFPWKPEWGGALRLYPVQSMGGKDGEEILVPSSEFSVVIPPSFNQLSFFTIQPGRSFHDVEEVYKGGNGEDEDDGGRMRMAISGWFHIPQEGEEGFEPGLEEKLAERSSLSQLQGKGDEFDLPQLEWRGLQGAEESDEADTAFTEDELEWLLRFISPTYLTPDTVEQLSEGFQENSVITLSEFLHPKFADKLREQLTKCDCASPASIPPHQKAAERVGTARPPHKHRYLYRLPAENQLAELDGDTPLDLLVEQFFPSQLFARWLSMVTGLTLSRAQYMARRFRRGLDYTLATAYEDDEPQLEVCLGVTPSRGWGGEDGEDDSDEENEVPARKEGNGTLTNGKGKENSKASDIKDSGEDEEVGGYEVYMAGDDDDNEGDVIEDSNTRASNTGAGQRRKAKADPAIYKSSAEDEDDGVLFTMPAGWNNLSIVLRDTGVLKFVKYVSRSAQGDRWDVIGNFTVVNADDGDEEDEDEDEVELEEVNSVDGEDED